MTTSINHPPKPENQLEADYLNASREHERIHKIYMNTSVFTPEGQSIKLKLAQANAEYVRLYHLVHPTHIVM